MNYNDQQNELQNLLAELCAESLSEEQAVRLLEILDRDPAARQIYVETVRLHCDLAYWPNLQLPLETQAIGSASVPPGTADSGKLPVAGASQLDGDRTQAEESALEGKLSESHGPDSPVLGFLGGAASFVSRLPVGLVLVGFVLVASLVMVSGFAVLGLLPVPDGQVPEIVSAPVAPPAEFVIRIDRVSGDCRWGGMSRDVFSGSRLRSGQQILLEQGLAEVDFNDEVSVILRGPAMFRVGSNRSGFLEFGSLVARVKQERAKGFTINSPSANVVDLGTEFGVAVDELGVTDVEVFSGSVDASLISRRGGSQKSLRMFVGKVARFDRTAGTIQESPVNWHAFHRRIPLQTYIAYQSLVGGVGNQDYYQDRLGLDFVVNDPVLVTKLGVFDSAADGLKRPISAELWSRSEMDTPGDLSDDLGVDILASLEFTPEDPGELEDSSRFKRLETPVLLQPGSYTIVASGYGPGEPNGNLGFHATKPTSDEWNSSIREFKRLESGRGALSFVGQGRHVGYFAMFPDKVDTFGETDYWVPDRYSAGTFEFQRADDLERHESGTEKVESGDEENRKPSNNVKRSKVD